jgi:hypothetical protein
MLIALEKLVAQDLDCNKVLRVGEIAPEIHFRGVAFAERLENLVLIVENGLLLQLWRFLLHETDDVA